MKRLLGIVLAVVLVVTLLLPINVALAKNDKAHRVTGGGIIDSGKGPVTCAFTAQQDDNEEYGVYGAKGEIVVKPHYEDVLVKATIVSLDVADNVAWIGGKVTQSNLDGMGVNTEFILEVVDNGEGKYAVDRMSNYAIGSSNASSRPDLNTEYYRWTIGNIQVQ